MTLNNPEFIYFIKSTVNVLAPESDEEEMVDIELEKNLSDEEMQRSASIPESYTQTEESMRIYDQQRYLFQRGYQQSWILLIFISQI